MKNFFQVGEFTNNELHMADIEWPGGKANPPQGTADKFHIKIVTLQEAPFIIVSDLDPDTGSCPGNQGSICDWGINEYITDDAIIRLSLITSQKKKFHNLFLFKYQNTVGIFMIIK